MTSSYEGSVVSAKTASLKKRVPPATLYRESVGEKEGIPVVLALKVVCPDYSRAEGGWSILMILHVMVM